MIVLEADDRVGGRLKAGEVAGRVVDFGGQWVGARHSMLHAEARRLGVEKPTPQCTPPPQGTVMQLLGKVVTFAGEVPRMSFLALLELARLQAALWDRDMKTVPAEAPWKAAKASEWDGQTLESWIVKNLHTREGRQFARLVPRGAWAADAGQISYLWFLDALRGGEGLDQLMAVKDGVLDAKFKGGMQQIAALMAGELGDRVVLERAGAQDRSKAKRASRRSPTRACSPRASSWSRFLPPRRPAFSSNRASARRPRRALPSACPWRPSSRWSWPTRRRSGARAGLLSVQVATDDDTLGIVMEDTQDVGPPIRCWPLFHRGRARHRHERGGQGGAKGGGHRLPGALLRPGRRPPHRPMTTTTGRSETWTHGYVGHMPPGVMTRFGHALREPCGRIHWAGAETAVEWPGYIEGALRSGIRAAREVSFRHNQ